MKRTLPNLFTLFALVLAACGVSPLSRASDRAATGKYAKYEEVVAETHATSLRMRKEALNGYLNQDPAKRFPSSEKWGGILWSMVALYLDERTDEANQLVRDLTNEYLAKYRSGEISRVWYNPEAGIDLPFSFFAGAEYVRMLYLFGSDSKFFPGRLKPETEKAMKDMMWIIVSEKSKITETTSEQLLVYHGTENHDILRRPYFYLMNYLFMIDPEYRDRAYADGFKAKDHYEAYNQYFLARPGMRAMAGHWVEAGSNTYQKYTPPSILNMAELAPDPVVRKRYKMLLDLIFIEEAQISVYGRRGGGRSRADFGGNSWESTKNIMYGEAIGKSFGSSHNKIFETSNYQLPASAIALRKIEFPTDEPFEIINRTLGERENIEYEADEDPRNVIKLNGRHLNYAYRTPHYLIGGHLQNPTLEYLGIARQYRWSGMLFHRRNEGYEAGNPQHPIEVSAIGPWYNKASLKAGRPLSPIWGVNYKNVMLTQRIPKGENGGSYNTGPVYIKFLGDNLKKTEKDGWIFASDGKAFAAIKFLDDEYTWNDKKDEAQPKDQSLDTKHRYLIHAGDIQSHGSLEKFREQILANKLIVEANQVRYTSDSENIDLTMYLYDPGNPKAFQVPFINGKPLDLTPESTYKSPYINSAFNEKKVTVTVGPIKEVYDFGELR
jgi:hypothetical protein